MIKYRFYILGMDAYIEIEATKKLWNEFQEKELLRAKRVVDRLLTEYIKKGQTVDAFREIWYSQQDDKKGEKHLYNLMMSCAQSRKPFAGNSFEKSIEDLHSMNNIKFYKQVWVDSDGNIHKKKPKDISVHKHDCLIPSKSENNNIADMIVISKKTTLRERFRQDLDSVGKCKTVVFLTREKPTKGQIDTITGYNCIIVYPNASNTKNTMCYEEYILRIKAFQEGTCDSIC